MYVHNISSAQLVSHVWLFVTAWTTAHHTSLSINSFHSMLKLMSIELVTLSTHLILCHPLLLCLQYFPASRSFPRSQLYASGGQNIKSFSFSISPFNEYAGLISFRVDWFDLLAVQGTLKGLLQHHSSKGKFFRVPLCLWSYSYIHTWLLEKP